ncbi:uncharacterized protein LOC123519874 isoform X2 [Portunus trituberculatus]|uniref:uncharacterized protein LOC123519874 isoform X2 n=1 Tax=Portunus trituberculatus TaxID=210409 RepID=UPI001E1CF752|nr:uncharacterized protein LOC123519874 isoform X2 [Portunus trituberculatus]
MAGRGAVLLLLMVLATTLTEDSAGQDLTAAEDGLMDLLEAEGVAESWEARGKGPDFPEEVEAKLKKEEGKDKKRKVKKVGKKEEENEKRKKVKKEGKRGEEENEEKRRRRKKKKAKVGKVCPGGRCVDSSERCGDGRAVRTASCKSGVCCVTASKKQEDEPEDRHRRKCRSRGPCKKVWGKCMPKRIGCPKGQTMLVNSKQLKYCSKNKCVCCTDEKPQPECVSKKCAKRKGFCTTDKKECPGEIKVSKKFCSGTNCVCCLPSKSCKINSKCEDLGGTCVDIKLGACKTQPLVGKEYCKGGKKCGCCVPEEGDVWVYGWVYVWVYGWVYVWVYVSLIHFIYQFFLQVLFFFFFLFLI